MPSDKPCTFGDGVTVKLDGVHELEPHQFELIETHKNVTVDILRCRTCGKISVGWRRQEDTEDEE